MSTSKVIHQQGIASLLVVILILVVIGIIGFSYLTTTSKEVSSRLPKNTNVLNSNVNSKQKMSDRFEIVGTPKLLFTGGYADPTISKLASGEYVMYLNNFTKQPAKYEAHTSTDGINWKKVTAKLPNASTGRAVKFGAQTRLYYPDRTPIRPSDPPASILTAISDDGITFTNESGTRIDPKESHYLEGPTVFKLPNGKYKMLFSENETASAEKRISKIWGAISDDGINWRRDDKPTLEADQTIEKIPSNWPQALHPFVLTRSDGSYLMFYNTHSEVYAAESTDGMTWTKLGKVGIHGADVDGYYQNDQTIRIYYGDFSPTTQGVVYTTILKEIQQ